jgi:subtilisin-like proprotein convertase family protein
MLAQVELHVDVHVDATHNTLGSTRVDLCVQDV